MRRLIGVPYAPVYFTLEDEAYALCKVCERLVRCRERKDEESFSKSEYVEHAMKRHPDLIVWSDDKGKD